LLSLLKNLNDSLYPLQEVIVVDSGEDRIGEDEYEIFENLPVIYLNSEKSVCIQRNKGIALAKCEWIFLCDDDIEVPNDYIKKIAEHVNDHSDTVAVSGLVLQKEKGDWVSQYPIKSVNDLLWKYIFKLSIWGEIKCKQNFLSNNVKRYYEKKGNHISKAGWPIIADFSGEYFSVPIYGLGASVIKKDWLIKFPFDEVLDTHGIGDNYGLAINFPANTLHILNNACAYHHQESINRLQKSLQYYRRVIALDYFRRANKNLKIVKKRWLLWSLVGNLVSFIFALDASMIKVGYKSVIKILFDQNPLFSIKEIEPPTAYDLWAQTYDQQTDNLIIYLDEIIFIQLLQNLNLKEKVIIDIGCGTGKHWEKILSGNPLELIGYEVSNEMLNRLHTKYPSAKTYLTPNNYLKESHNNSCDLIISTLVIGYIDNLDYAFAEWNRVLKRGGNIIITDFHPVSIQNGAKRSFNHMGRSIAIRNYLHTLSKIRLIAKQLEWLEIEFIERKVDEHVRFFYEKLNALHIYQDSYGTPLVYGIKFSKS